MSAWDPSETFAAVNDLVAGLGRTPTIAEFLEERRRRNVRGASIPHTPAIYARYGSFADMIKAAGVICRPEPEGEPLRQCLESLLACAEALGQDAFTTTAYDAWRAGSPEHWSASVVRKWYGTWANALAALAAELAARRARLTVAAGPRARLSPLAA